MLFYWDQMTSYAPVSLIAIFNKGNFIIQNIIKITLRVTELSAGMMAQLIITCLASMKT